jgi:hypothetical protein
MTDKVHWNITVFDQGFDAGSSMNVRSMMKRFGSFSVKFPKSNVSSLQKRMKKLLHNGNLSQCVTDKNLADVTESCLPILFNIHFVCSINHKQRPGI